MAPAQTPKEIVARPHMEITEALQTAKVRDQLVPNGIESLALTSEQFNAPIAKEIKVALEGELIGGRTGLSLTGTSSRLALGLSG
jgi:tripartite-type tricarboxylate transporter receptor subunit TctC